eukprot:scaffold4248_cov231-Pinguiococcus_pyrenoidosus.AAC.3
MTLFSTFFFQFGHGVASLTRSVGCCSPTKILSEQPIRRWAFVRARCPTRLCDGLQLGDFRLLGGPEGRSHALFYRVYIILGAHADEWVERLLHPSGSRRAVPRHHAKGEDINRGSGDARHMRQSLGSGPAKRAQSLVRICRWHCHDGAQIANLGSDSVIVLPEQNNVVALDIGVRVPLAVQEAQTERDLANDLEPLDTGEALSGT